MATYYVSKSGDDANGGTSYANSWLTIQHAVDNVGSGDTIKVGSGIYEENVVISTSEIGDVPFTLQADSYVVLDGTVIGGTGFYFTMSEYYDSLVTFDGFIFKSYTKAISTSYAGQIARVVNCVLEDTQFYIDSTEGGGEVIAENTVFDNSNMYFYRGWQAESFSIQKCTFVNSGTIVVGSGISENAHPSILSCYFGTDILFGDFVLVTLDYNNIRGKITYQDITYDTLADFQDAYPDLASHSINKEPDFNDDYTLRWSSPNLGAGEAGADIGARGAATYYTGTGDLFDGATLTDVSRDENGDFKLDNGATTGTIVSAVLDFGTDITLGNIRWLSTETYPLDVIDSDNTDTEPNRREIEYRSQTDAQGSFAQGDPAPPNWTDVERNDDLSLSCRYFQVRITLRDNGVAA